MSLILWSDKYSVSIPSIDTQHKKLFTIINTLHEAMSQGKSKDIMGQTLNELIYYTKTHFKFEEELLQKKNFPGYLTHKLAHDNFVSKINNYYSEYNNGKLSFSLDLILFLKDWLINHIDGTDRKYIPYLS